MRRINVGLIGFGTVGAGVVKALKDRRGLLKRKTNIPIIIKKIADKNITTRRIVTVPKTMLTTDAHKILNDPAIDIVVELVGGIHPAKEFIIKALKSGKHVVTANKALLAQEGKEIFEMALANNVDIYFEASVGGGIPIIKALREGLIVNEIDTLYGIINGTSNYILSKMTQEGLEFKEALLQAQKLGFAEKNPSLDIEGFDSAHKLAILTLLGFGRNINLKDIYVEGILDVSLKDIQYADEFGCMIKLLAIAKRENEELEVRVHPTLLPKEHLLSSVNGVYNAVYIKGDLVGEQVFYGQGAGQKATSSAVISDIVDLSYNIANGISRRSPNLKFDGGIKKIRKMEDIETRYYLRFSAIDRPGVFAAISGILGKHKISIASVIQKERKKERIVPVVLMTHEARESAVRLALEEVDKLRVIRRKSVAIRMEKE